MGAGRNQLCESPLAAAGRWEGQTPAGAGPQNWRELLV